MKSRALFLIIVLNISLLLSPQYASISYDPIKDKVSKEQKKNKEIPIVESDSSKILLISGEWRNIELPNPCLSPCQICIRLKKGQNEDSSCIKAECNNIIFCKIIRWEEIIKFGNIGDGVLALFSEEVSIIPHERRLFILIGGNLNKGTIYLASPYIVLNDGANYKVFYTREGLPTIVFAKYIQRFEKGESHSGYHHWEVSAYILKQNKKIGTYNSFKIFSYITKKKYLYDLYEEDSTKVLEKEAIEISRRIAMIK